MFSDINRLSKDTIIDFENLSNDNNDLLRIIYEKEKEIVLLKSDNNDLLHIIDEKKELVEIRNKYLLETIDEKKLVEIRNKDLLETIDEKEKELVLLKSEISRLNNALNNELEYKIKTKFNYVLAELVGFIII